MAIPRTTTTTVRHALNRWTFGATPALAAAVKKSGLRSYLDSQLATWREADPTADAVVAMFPAIRMSPVELASSYSAERAFEVTDQLQAATIVRAVSATHQLYERMVEFWTDHFAIDLGSDAQWLLKPGHDRDAIRKHALGRFEDLLIASSQSVAMLHSLDQTKSVAGNPNENFARELLELHTLGVDGGYAEQDVKEAARLLTGWSVNLADLGFLFWDWVHDSAPATILGKRYGASGSGLADGVQLLKDLAHHRSTARHLAKKLCRRFVSDTPSTALVESVANAYLAADTDIAATLRHLFNQSEFWKAINKKHRRPIDVFVAFLRATSSELVLTNPDAATEAALRRWLVAAFEILGQAPMRWPTPDGYPDVSGAWMHAGGLLARWNVFLSAVQGYLWFVALNPAAVAGSSPPATAGQLVDRVAQALLSRSPTAAERDACLAYLGVGATGAIDPGLYDLRARHLIALVGSSPAFQRR